MTPRFIGLLDFAPQDPHCPDLWQLEQPLGQITSDGHLIICVPWKRTDGASIPRWLWPLLDHPFGKKNRWWAVPHDQGYNRQAVVIDLKTPAASLMTPERWVALWANVPHTMHTTHDRKWWDGVMVEAMGLKEETRTKKAFAYMGVRTFGSRPWNKARKAA